MQSTGRYEEDRIAGEWVWFFKNGERRGTGGFDDEERKHGVWRRWRANGQLWDEGEFAHGKKVGSRKTFDEAGELVMEQSFKSP